MSEKTNNKTDEKYILRMENITKTFPGVKALDNVSFSLKSHSVHALMGENGAGKSTLMKCLFGIYTKDSGKIFLNEKEVNFKSAKEALQCGVSMVHQELNQVLQRNVLDNIWLGRYPIKGIFIDEKKMFDDTIKIFKDLDINVNPKVKMGSLPVAQRQMIEIAKAVSYNSKVIVMDEPTSSLTENEVEHLFRIIKKLKDQGVGIIYISHKMEEIKRISDYTTVLRDGTWVGTEPSEDITTDKIINMMVGRDLKERFPEKYNKIEERILEVTSLTSTDLSSIKDVSFDLHKGEILGIAGLVGSKRTEILETIFGLQTKSKGTIKLKGQPVTNKTPKESIKNGFALVTEERRSTGIFSMLDVKFNSTISNLNSYLGSSRLLNGSKLNNATKWVIDNLKVKTPSQTTPLRSLSGGNQQKVILGRWLLTEPDILMLDEPTRGIDVLAKYEIYQLMIELASKGKSIIMVSSEMPELIGITDRIVVMSNGKVAGIVKTSETSQEEIMHLSSKYL